MLISVYVSDSADFNCITLGYLLEIPLKCLDLISSGFFLYHSNNHFVNLDFYIIDKFNDSL